MDRCGVDLITDLTIGIALIFFYHSNTWGKEELLLVFFLGFLFDFLSPTAFPCVFEHVADAGEGTHVFLG